MLEWLWLANGLGYGAPGAGPLLDAFDTPAEIQKALGSPGLNALLTKGQAEKLAGTKPEYFAPTLAEAERLGIQVIPYSSPLYPERLRRIPTPPPVLYCRGDARLLDAPLSIGMVGTRRPSAYGVEAAKAIGEQLASAGAVIISGLAAGLDSQAHKAALAVEGATLACIAFGHSFCYPKANQKLKELLERYGAVVSEYPPATGPEKVFFLQRNRLIAALSHGLLVTEARRYSGTMSTVNFAAEYGRDVFAVPGSIFSPLSDGTNAMIREGACLAASGADVLSVYGQALEEPPAQTQLSPPHLSDTAGEVLSQLGPKPLSLGEVCVRTGIATGAVMAALTELELAGLIRQQAGRLFVIA